MGLIYLPDTRMPDTTISRHYIYPTQHLSQARQYILHIFSVRNTDVQYFITISLFYYYYYLLIYNIQYYMYNN
jgi:hypothetical protein